jgi:hypothetical protein
MSVTQPGQISFDGLKPELEGVDLLEELLRF